MNKELEKYSRIWLCDNAAKLPYQWQNIFKLMYGRKDGKRTVNETLVTEIETVIKEIKPKQINWAMTQIVNSLDKVNQILIDFGYTPKTYKKLKG